MKKLYLSVISLGLCLILGFGSLAAQGKGQGKKENPKTMFEVSLLADEDSENQPGAPVVWLFTPGGCEGFSEEPNLSVTFRPRFVCPKVDGTTSGTDVTLDLYPFLISVKTRGGQTTGQIFFESDEGRYQTEGFDAGMTFPTGNGFNIVVNNNNVLVTKSKQPFRGSQWGHIALGTMHYERMP